jgi:hypothetical protein
MKKFLFIVPLTPSNYLTPLRKELFSLFINALKEQTHPYWKALLIGEEEKTDGNIIYKKIVGISKEVKLMYAREFISTLSEKPDFLIRLDDDDLISPTVLARAAATSVEFDCYTDKYHAYFDVVSGKICQALNPWLPNTVIHKFRHAMAEFSEDNIPLFQLDHSKEWVKYYKGKKIFFEKKTSPVYLRVLSPTAGTSRMHAMRLLTFSAENLLEYSNNISVIGKWKLARLQDFEKHIDKLNVIWRKIPGLPSPPIYKKRRALFSWFNQ